MKTTMNSKKEAILNMINVAKANPDLDSAHPDFKRYIRIDEFLYMVCDENGLDIDLDEGEKLIQELGYALVSRPEITFDGEPTICDQNVCHIDIYSK